MNVPQNKKTTLRAHVKYHYDKRMPNKKHHRIIIWVVFLFIVVTIALQMLYPLDRALPFARIASRDVSWQGHDRLAKQITDKFAATKLHIQVDAKRGADYKLSLAGAEPKTEAMISELTEYPFWQRFIPLSILLQHPDVKNVQVDYASSVLATFADGVSKKLSFEPTNAGLAIKDGQIVATDDVSGSQVTTKSVVSAIRASTLRLGTTSSITVPAKRQPATTTSADFKEIKARAEAALTRPVVITVGDKTFKPDSHEVASWLSIGADASKAPVLTLDLAKLGGYFDTLDKQAGTPAGQTVVSVVDGREASRTAAPKGTRVQREPLTELLSQLLLQGTVTSPLRGTLVDVEPSVKYLTSYTSSEAGLRAYVADASRNQNANIVIQQVSGNGWSANADGAMSIPSASTYKLFIALMLFSKMDEGKINWNDPMLDTTVSGCFDRMTIASTNPCAQKWIADWGASNVNEFVYARGFSRGTDFTRPDATHTTANDLTKFMIGLNNGSVVNGAHRDRLLHSLSVHPYRYGIPTGSAGRVEDKVGFLWDYIHDTAIVHHPKGTYVMTVMTKGRSYATIAAITREVERIMYP